MTKRTDDTRLDLIAAELARIRADILGLIEGGSVRQPKPGEVWLDGEGNEMAALRAGTGAHSWYILGLTSRGAEWVHGSTFVSYVRDFDLTFGKAD